MIDTSTSDSPQSRVDRVLDNIELDNIAQRRNWAVATLFKLCSGEQPFTMSVPARPDDTDTILYNSLEDLERAMREIYRLRGGIKRVLIDHWGQDAAIQEALSQLLFGTGEQLPEEVAGNG